MKKIKAFTVAETLIVITIIGVFIAFTVASTLNIGKLNDEKKYSSSRSFYTNVSNAFKEIILFESTDMGTLRSAIANVKAIGEYGNNNTEIFGGLFTKYMDGEETECSDDEFNNITGAFSTNESFCATFSNGIYARFQFHGINNEQIYISDYFMNNESERTRKISNPLATITYGFKDSRGELGLDFFRIAFGNGNLK